jgi:hypothetical protein
MNSISVPVTFYRLCWFCQGKCNFISICNSCENDIKNRKSIKKNIKKNTWKKLGQV